MSLRVIAGSARGTRLHAVPGDCTRPIMDRAKEALFNIIGEDIFQASFLDLFAGTGSVGIEALSRGADRSLFIDINRKAIKTIRDNLKRTRLDGKAIVRQRDAFDILAHPPQQPFDFIYVAPPQYQGLWWDVLIALDKNPQWHNANTKVISQIDPREFNSERVLQNLNLFDQRKYGSTLLLFYEFVEDNSNPGSQDMN